MKLDMDCFRAVLLAIEDQQQFFVDNSGNVTKTYLNLDDLSKTLPEYNKADIAYAVINLKDAGYISASIKWINSFICYCCISDVTYEGHQLADKLRDSQRWKKMKAGLNAVRDYSLSAIESIAEGMTSAAITAFLSQNP